MCKHPITENVVIQFKMHFLSNDIQLALIFSYQTALLLSQQTIVSKITSYFLKKYYIEHVFVVLDSLWLLLDFLRQTPFEKNNPYHTHSPQTKFRINFDKMHEWYFTKLRHFKWIYSRIYFMQPNRFITIVGIVKKTTILKNKYAKNIEYHFCHLRETNCCHSNNRNDINLKYKIWATINNPFNYYVYLKHRFSLRKS